MEKHVNQHLPDSIVPILLSSSAYALNSVKTIMYHSSSSSASTGMAMTSPTYSTYGLPHSRIGPMPSSSAFRYGFSIDYTDPFLSGQQFYPAWASCPNPRTHSRSLLAKEDAGLMVPPSARTPSACTATCPARMPTPQGSNAPVRRVEEGCHLAPLKLPTCNDHELSLGSHALEGWQTRV